MDKERDLSIEARKENLYSPIIWDENAADAELVNISSSKSPEEKLYYLIYTDPVEGNTSCEICYGRTTCYKTIQRLVISYDYLDPIDIKVLVEVVGIDVKTKKYRWFMMNPNDPKCLNAYRFCKQVEDQFDDGFSIDDYSEGLDGQDDSVEFEQTNPVDAASAQQAMFNKSLFGGEQEVADAFGKALKEMIESPIEPALFLHPDLYQKQKDLFAKPDENPFGDNKV